MNTNYQSYLQKPSHARTGAVQRNRPNQTTEKSSPPVRPKSSRGRNRINNAANTAHSVSNVPQNVDSQPRPKSSRGRHIRDSQISPGCVNQNYNSVANSERYRSTEKVIPSEHKTYYQPLKSDESSADQTDLPRPKSSRGRRTRDTVASPASGEAVEQESSKSPLRRARPKSAKGRARTPFRNQPSYHHEQQQGQTDILVIDQPSSPNPLSYGYTDYGDSPRQVAHGYAEYPVQTSYDYPEQRFSPQPMPYDHSDYQAQSYEEPQVVYSPQSEVDIDIHSQVGVFGSNEPSVHDSPSDARNSPQGPNAFRPMSGRSSARPPTAAERRQYSEGASKDNEILRATTGTPMSGRPDSASSFSRYSILPSIGLKPVAAQRPIPTRIPSAYREPIQREDSIPQSSSQPSHQAERVAASSVPMKETFHTMEPMISESMNFLSVNDDDNLVNPVNTGAGDVQAGDASSHLFVGETLVEVPIDATASHVLTRGEPNQSSFSFENDSPEARENPENAENPAVSTNEIQPNGSSTGDAKNKETAEQSNVPTFPPLLREISLPSEPKQDENSLLLAIKLPDGKRVQRRFLKSQTLKTVLNFAEFTSQLDFTGTEIVCDAPRKVFSDLSIKLCDSGLQHRTVIHIHIPDI